MIVEGGLMRVDESHPVRLRVPAQDAVLAQSQSLELRQKLVLHEGRYVGEPLRIGVEGRMNVETGAAARAGSAAACERWICVGRVDDTREAADQRPQRLAQFCKSRSEERRVGKECRYRWARER